MKYSSPELILDKKAFLGEGPAWDAARQQLLWVDIFAGHLHVYDPHSGGDHHLSLGEPLGTAAPAWDGRVALALKDSLALLDIESGRLETLARPEEHIPGNRFNDGKCGPDGRFVAGSMDNAEVAASGSLYSLGVDGKIKTLLEGVRISNGLTWSPDHRCLYYIDTPTRQIRVFDYDLQSGEIANPRVAVTVPPELGWPDGMTSDAQGRLWVALWSGAALTVWDPGNGSLLEKIELPAKNVTSCVFGGANLDELYVTTARKDVAEAALREYPLSGGVFRIRTGVQGMPTFVFGQKT